MSEGKGRISGQGRNRITNSTSLFTQLSETASGFQKRLGNLGRKVQDRFSPRHIGLVTYKDADGQLKSMMFKNSTIEYEQGGVFALIKHDTGTLRIESQRLIVYEEKAWNRADYVDVLADAPEDGDEETKQAHSPLMTGRW